MRSSRTLPDGGDGTDLPLVSSPRLPRRLVLGVPALLVAACASPNADDEGTATASPSDGGDTASNPVWRMPDEGEPHERTWMAFGASAQIWGEDLVPVVQQNLADIANAIVAFEPVTILVRDSDIDTARTLLDAAVEIQPAELDDLWIRDTGPVFVVGDDDGTPVLGGVNFNFNGWGDKQEHAADARVAGEVTDAAEATAVPTELVLEGGGLEVDGHGTAIITRSCVLNDNRNPGWSQEDVEAELSRLLGIRSVIWLPGIAGRDITDGHTDFYARFVGPGQVVAALDDDPESYDYAVTREHLEILRAATDAEGNPLTVTTLTAPTVLRDTEAAEDFAAGYINFYVCNGAVIVPQFGDDDADAAARDALAALYPDREIVQVDIDGIAAGGGGIHCATQQQPRR